MTNHPAPPDQPDQPDRHGTPAGDQAWIDAQLAQCTRDAHAALARVDADPLTPTEQAALSAAGTTIASRQDLLEQELHRIRASRVTPDQTDLLAALDATTPTPAGAVQLWRATHTTPERVHRWLTTPTIDPDTIGPTPLALLRSGHLTHHDALQQLLADLDTHDRT